MSYRLTPSCTNLSPCSDGEIINQSTADDDRSAEMSDTVGAMILQETVAAVNGGQTLPIRTTARMRIIQMLFLITFQR